MKKIELFGSDSAGYPAVSTFAQEIYWSKLSFSLNHFPELFFAITEDDHILGCMGLNTNVRSPLFLNNFYFKQYTANQGKNIKISEQSVLALNRYSLGLPILISVTAAYAHSIDIQRIVYAGIDVSCKAIESLGYQVTKCGQVDLGTLPHQEQKNYIPWRETYNPEIYILDTQPSNTICSLLMERLQTKIKMSANLRRLIQL
ncbi:MAG: hypothetical protein ACI92I_000049 [Acidimicrobiales bacterium]|jgi:hypothetical protein